MCLIMFVNFSYNIHNIKIFNGVVYNFLETFESCFIHLIILSNY